MAKSIRHIEIVPNKDPLLGGPEVHIIRFLYGKSGKEVVLTTRELKELKHKLGIYLLTYNLEEPKQLSIWP